MKNQDKVAMDLYNNKVNYFFKADNNNSDNYEIYKVTNTYPSFAIKNKNLNNNILHNYKKLIGVFSSIALFVTCYNITGNNIFWWIFSAIIIAGIIDVCYNGIKDCSNVLDKFIDAMNMKSNDIYSVEKTIYEKNNVPIAKIYLKKSNDYYKTSVVNSDGKTEDVYWVTDKDYIKRFDMFLTTQNFTPVINNNNVKSLTSNKTVAKNSNNTAINDFGSSNHTLINKFIASDNRKGSNIIATAVTELANSLNNNLNTDSKMIEKKTDMMDIIDSFIIDWNNPTYNNIKLTDIYYDSTIIKMRKIFDNKEYLSKEDLCDYIRLIKAHYEQYQSLEALEKGTLFSGNNMINTNSFREGKQYFVALTDDLVNEIDMKMTVNSL